MISEHELFTLTELYLLNGRCFGFYVVNALPRSYVQVIGFGRYVGSGDDQRWLNYNLLEYTPEEARKRNLVFQVDRYAFVTHERIGQGLTISDSKGWSRYQPDL